MTVSPLANATILGYSGHMSGPNGRITRVVVHATVSPCVPGGARANARYFQSSTAGGLAHYVVDPDEIIACCDEDTACWHAPPNVGSIGVELCDPQTGDDWGDDAHQRMLARATALVADICARHGLPTHWLSASNLLAGDTGITGHAEVSAAWHETDHTDPGPSFPIAAFVAQVSGPAPQPHPSECDMTPGQCRDKQGHKWHFVVDDGGHCYSFRDGKPNGPLLDNDPGWTSGFDAVCDPDGTIAVAGRNGKGELAQIVFTPGGAKPLYNVIGGHIYPPV